MVFNVGGILGIKLDANSLHDGLYDVKITYKIFKLIIDSGNLIMPFNETKAIEMFNEQKIKKAQEKKFKSAFTEDTAWIKVNP